MTPNLLHLVEQVQRDHPGRFQVNTGANCFWIVCEVLKLSGDPDWGHVGKTAGEGQFTPSGWMPRHIKGVDGRLYTITGVSHDAIFHQPTLQQIDLLGGGNDGDQPLGAPSRAQWGVIPIAFNRPGNPWLAALPVDASIPPPGPPPSPPQPVYPPYPANETDLDAVGVALFADFAEAGQTPNPQAFRFVFRVAYDWLVKNEPSLAASTAKHRAEWRQMLGLPPR